MKTLSVVLAALLAGCAGTMTQPSGPGAVKITPLGSHDGEFCARDRAMVFEDPDGTRILYDAGFTVRGPNDPRLGKIDAVLLKLPGVSTRKIKGLHAYFVSDRMFACISGNGVGLRLPVTVARELHFSRNDVVPFQPAGLPATKEWIQIDHADVLTQNIDRTDR